MSCCHDTQRRTQALLAAQAGRSQAHLRHDRPSLQEDDQQQPAPMQHDALPCASCRLCISSQTRLWPHVLRSIAMHRADEPTHTCQTLFTHRITQPRVMILKRGVQASSERARTSALPGATQYALQHGWAVLGAPVEGQAVYEARQAQHESHHNTHSGCCTAAPNAVQNSAAVQLADRYEVEPIDH